MVSVDVFPISTANDIPGYKSVSYVESNESRLRKSKDNIFAAEDLQREALLAAKLSDYYDKVS